MSPTGSQRQASSGARSEPQPAAPVEPRRDGAPGTSGDQAGGGGQVEPPAGQGGAGPAVSAGGDGTAAAPEDGNGAAVGDASDGSGPRRDGGGTPPAGSASAGSTSGGDDTGGGSGGGSGVPGSAPPIASPGARFPEPVGLALTRLAELAVPLALAFRAQEPESLYVALRHGEVVRLTADGGRADSAALLRRDAEAVLDMRGRVDTRGEMGLLGLTFSPAGDRLYTSSVNRSQVSELWEWPVAPDGSVDAGGGRLVLSLEQPFRNHNGGDVTFGPDGYLYLGFGDGGGGGDPLRAGQDPHDWLGTILRIDPRRGPAGEPYTVPATNPFADGVAGAPEVWVWGARNPWRFSFDRANGDLWVSDVGQDLLEEINRLPAAGGGAGRGANLGWSDYEGSAPFWSNTEPPGHVRPVVEYRHGADARCSVTGGYAYRGSRLPGLSGVYLYSDFCDGTLWGYSEVAGAHPIPLADGAPLSSVLSFGQGPDGEIYVLTGNALWRLEAS
jgi:glucose/arabinose dehydrogenase